MTICPCFLYEPDPDSPLDEPECTCGHQADEHDEFGDCTAEYVELIEEAS